MKRRSHLTEVAYLLLVAYSAILAAYLLASRLTAYAECPTCYKNENPAPATPDAQGKQ